MTQSEVSLGAVLGGRTAKAMAASLGLSTVGDLLRHYPRRYAERGELTDFTTLVEGEQVTILAEVKQVTVRPMRNRRGSLLEAVVTDGRSSVSLTFFNQKWREGQLKAGRRGLFAGTVSRYRNTVQLTHPEFELLPDGVGDEALALSSFAGALIPIYPASAAVTSWQIYKAIDVVLAAVDDLMDPLPSEMRDRLELIAIADALRGIHRPSSRSDVERAVERLRFEEAFLLQVVLAQRREELRRLPALRRVPERSELLGAFDARLPFELTSGQRSVGVEIDEDLSREHPMHRLLQGDVGSGKTVVALRAMLRVVDAGGQAVLLAPTEVLAAQHHRSIVAALGPLGMKGQLGGAEVSTKVALLTGSQRTAHKRKELLDIVSGEAGIVVGTHALIQDRVEFNDLALVVIDEQHRFGVEQRAVLASKAKHGTRPHVLVMTATPIPRTVAMTVFGDVDVSTLSELPAGRAEITTHVVDEANPAHFERVWTRVREEVATGHRVFVVCPRIGDGDESDDEVAADEVVLHGVAPFADELAQGPLAGLSVAVMHGRMSPDAKDDVMRRFASAEVTDPVEVLVSTTVIEVGIDVPIATMMVIMDADRFGVSQLHQLRGRVGRGGLPGLCLLVTASEPGSPARERLDAVASTTDGFELAALDLQQRREGDVLGSSQSGRRSSLRLLEVARHEDVIVAARAEATRLVDSGEIPVEVADAVAALLADDQAEFLEKA